MSDTELNVGLDPNGNLCLQFQGKLVCLCPHDALRVASTITGLMAQHFPPPAPQIIQPDRRLAIVGGNGGSHQYE